MNEVVMKKIIHIMVGIPGSGKSTWVQKYRRSVSPFAYYLNADSIREYIYGDENIQGNGKLVFDVLYEKLKYHCMDSMIDAIYIDNTSVSYESRKKLYDIIEKNCSDCQIKLVVFTCHLKAFERNTARARVVPEHVMQRMVNNFQLPTAEEIEKHNLEVIWVRE